MTTFYTKVWGYNPVTWPVLGFATPAGANKLAGEYRTGDWVVIAGTQTHPTAGEDRGRLLGMVQVTNTIVDVEPILKSLGTEIEEHAYRDGEFRWARGFPFLSALRFTDKPLVIDIFPERSRHIGQAEAAYALKLSADEVEAINRLATVDVDFPIAAELRPEMKLKEMLTAPGPVPAMGVRDAEYVDGDNCVYIFRIQKTDFFKVGRTNDIERRLNEFNCSPHAIHSSQPLEIVASHVFSDAATAHAVEQLLHEKLKDYANGHECFTIRKNGLPEVSLASAVFEHSRA